MSNELSAETETSILTVSSKTLTKSSKVSTQTLHDVLATGHRSERYEKVYEEVKNLQGNLPFKKT